MQSMLMQSYQPTSAPWPLSYAKELQPKTMSLSPSFKLPAQAEQPGAVGAGPGPRDGPETNPTPEAVFPASTPIVWPASTPTPMPTSTLASGASDETVRLWRVSECASLPEGCGRLLHTLEGHADSVTSVAFSPDGTLLASGARDGTIRLWAVREE
jgi:WD40 repeat protein